MIEALTRDRLLGGRVLLGQPAQGYRVAIDPVLLAAAVPADAGARVLDAGAGTGAAALCLAVRVPGCRVVGIELQPALQHIAAANVTDNALASRVEILPGDLTRLTSCRELRSRHDQSPLPGRSSATPPPQPERACAHVEGTPLDAWLGACLRMLRTRRHADPDPSRRAPGRDPGGPRRSAGRPDHLPLVAGAAGQPRQARAGAGPQGLARAAGAAAGAGPARAPTAGSAPRPRRCCATARRWPCRLGRPMLDVRGWLGRLRSRAPVVPVVRLNGVIGGSSLRGGGLSLNSVNPSLERAFKLRGAKAVALAINSPGGSPVQSALIAGRIRALAAREEAPRDRLRRGCRRLGRLLAGAGRRRDLCRPELDRGQHRGDQRGLRLRRGAGPARHRAPGLYRGCQEGAARPVPAGRSRRRRAPPRHPRGAPPGLQGDRARAPRRAPAGRRQRPVRGPDLDRPRRPRSRPDRWPGRPARRAARALWRQGAGCR